MLFFISHFQYDFKTNLLVTVVKDEDDGGGEEDGDQADGETQDPVVADCDVEVKRGEHGAPHNNI